VQSLIALYNCVTKVLKDRETQNSETELWTIPEVSRFKSSFNPYQEQFEQRLLHQLSSPRLAAIQDSLQKSFLHQKLEDASRFLDNDIARYKALNLNYAKNKNSSSEEDLQKLLELILLDIRFLAGCDIRWDQQPSSKQSNKNADNTVPDGRKPHASLQHSLSSMSGRAGRGKDRSLDPSAPVQRTAAAT
jgi:hypothetical protein